jgi:tRNA dimethylallyltransferase
MIMSGLTPLRFIVGPTAAGKSAAAMLLAEQIGAEIISADAVQVYRGLDIGSAKPTAEEQARVPHHLIDIADPSESMDAARWRAQAVEAIEAITSRGHEPLVVGGSGLYVRALVFGLMEVPEISESIRLSVRERIELEGPEPLHAELALHDPSAAARIAPRDRQRIGRALEVFLETGRPLSAWQDEHEFSEPLYDARVVGLWPEKTLLNERIDARAAQMVQAGWVAEVRSLMERGVSPTSPGLSALGYRDVVAHVQQKLPGSMLAERVASGHRRYAKRQLTWFRGQTSRDHELVHLDPTSADLGVSLLRWAEAP